MANPAEAHQHQLSFTLEGSGESFTRSETYVQGGVEETSSLILVRDHYSTSANLGNSGALEWHGGDRRATAERSDLPTLLRRVQKKLMGCCDLSFKVNVSKAGILAAAMALLSACSNAPPASSGPAHFAGGGLHAVYITNHGWHTGVIVPAAPLQARVPDLAERFPAARQIELGWGDKDFYQAAESSLGLALRAILWPTDTVVRATGIYQPIAQFPQPAGLVGLCVDDHAFSALLTFLEQSFARGPEGEARAAPSSRERVSQFYEGTGQYHLLNTCNSWTAKGLNSMGMDISPTLKLTAGSIIGYLEQHPEAVSLSVYQDSAQTGVRPFSCGP